MIIVSTEQVAATTQYSTNKPMPTLSRRTRQIAHCIVARPNQSASWHDNKILILALGLPCALVAATFGLVAGAWMVLPFAGLEITGLSAALYIVCKRLQYRHVLIFDNYQLSVEKGDYRPQQVWHFVLDSLSISVERPPHPWDPLKIHLYGNDLLGNYQQVRVGDFLNKQDSQQLLNVLRQQGLNIRNDSPSAQIDA